jgi:hypothetical protein
MHENSIDLIRSLRVETLKAWICSYTVTAFCELRRYASSYRILNIILNDLLGNGIACVTFYIQNRGEAKRVGMSGGQKRGSSFWPPKNPNCLKLWAIQQKPPKKKFSNRKQEEDRRLHYTVDDWSQSQVEAEAEDVTLKQIAASSVISYYRLRRKERKKESWTRRESPSRRLHRRIGRPRDPHLSVTHGGGRVPRERWKAAALGGYGRVYTTGYFKLSEPHRVFGP